MILVGPAKSGKTQVLQQLVNKKFSKTNVPSIGMDFKVYPMKVKDNREVKLQVWDAAG